MDFWYVSPDNPNTKKVKLRISLSFLRGRSSSIREKVAALAKKELRMHPFFFFFLSSCRHHSKRLFFILVYFFNLETTWLTQSSGSNFHSPSLKRWEGNGNCRRVFGSRKVTRSFWEEVPKVSDKYSSV
jgi:hypothetical protein